MNNRRLTKGRFGFRAWCCLARDAFRFPDDDDGGFGAIILAIGGGLFTISLWLWSFALIGGVVWAIREDALPIYDDKEIQEVVDAMLDLDT